MSTRERYIKVIESLVNGEEAKAADQLHEAFVEKAREIWNDLVEQDEIIEDEVAEEETVDEGLGGDKADDFIDDIEEDDDEIEAEEMYGEDKGEESPDMSEPEAEMELSDEEPKDGDDVDFDGDGETDDHEADHEEIQDKLVNVEDALADLKTEFAKIMGDSEDEAPAEDMPEMPADDAEEDKVEEAKDDAEAEENLEEAAELKKVGKDGMHPKDMPAGDDGKASPVAGKNDMGGKAVDMSAKGSEGDKSGLVDAPKDMGVTHPGDGAKLSPEAKGHGAEKKGKAE
jgi:hypothetical protein